MLGLISCNSHSKENANAETKKLSAVYKIIKARSDSVEKIYLATIDKIDSSLNDIRDSQGNIILGSNSNFETRASKKDEIINNIAMINDLLKENKNTIAALEKSLAEYKQYKTSFDELSQTLKVEKEKAETLEKQITVMKLALVEKDFIIEELNKSVSAKDSSIQDMAIKNKAQEVKLNRTYYAYGTFKKLKEEKIIEKEGGVLGVTSAKVVSDKLNNKDFKEMDMLKDTTIQIAGKDPKIITKHPDGTYKLETENKDLSVLIIKDPEKFWNVSKYLVVEVH